MTISLIAAVSENLVIGKDSRLPWHLPSDMRYFRDVTTGHCILSGRKNYFTIPPKIRPLSNRTNIVVSRQKELFEEIRNEGAEPVNTVEEGIRRASLLGEKELFVIGGGEIYKQTIGIADKLYITWVYATIEGDVFFPEFLRNIPSHWDEVKHDLHNPDEKHKFAYSFCIYEKTK